MVNGRDCTDGRSEKQLHILWSIQEECTGQVYFNLAYEILKYTVE